MRHTRRNGCEEYSAADARSAAGGRNQTSAIVRSSVANSVTLLAREDGDGASEPVPRLLRHQEVETQMHADKKG